MKTYLVPLYLALVSLSCHVNASPPEWASNLKSFLKSEQRGADVESATAFSMFVEALVGIEEEHGFKMAEAIHTNINMIPDPNAEGAIMLPPPNTAPKFSVEEAIALAGVMRSTYEEMKVAKERKGREILCSDEALTAPVEGLAKAMGRRDSESSRSANAVYKRFLAQLSKRERREVIAMVEKQKKSAYTASVDYEKLYASGANFDPRADQYRYCQLTVDEG